MTLKDLFLKYITEYSFGKPRVTPANPKTIGRQRRGLNLVEKLIGHSLDDVTDEDQLVYMEKIRDYAQGTRIVSTTIFQRFLWWGTTNGYLTCSNLIKGNEAEIVGDKTPVRYAFLSQKDIALFLRKLTVPKQRLVLHIVYMTGADSSDIIDMRVEDVREDHITLRRMKLGSTQVIYLPEWLQKELYEYAQEQKQGQLFFDKLDNVEEQRDRELDYLWKQACLSTGLFHHTTFKDFRVNAIKHFYFNTSDEESVRAFAGVGVGKKGWIEDLLTDQEVFLKDKLAERFNNG